MYNQKKNNKINWNIDENLSNILNEIDIFPEKRIVITTGEKQFMCNDGQIYQVNSRKYMDGEQISKTDFNERTNDFMINYKCSRKKENIRDDI